MPEQRPDRPTPKRNRPGLTNGGMKFGRGLMGWLLFVALAALLFVWLKKSSTATANIPINQFWEQIEKGNVEQLAIDGDEVIGKLKQEIVVSGTGNKTGPPAQFRTNFPPGVLTSWEFTRQLIDATNKTTLI